MFVWAEPLTFTLQCGSSASFARELETALFNDHQKTLAELVCACLLKIVRDEEGDLQEVLLRPKWPGWVQEVPRDNEYASRHFLLQCRHGVLRSFSPESLSKLTQVLNNHQRMWNEGSTETERWLSAEAVESILLRIQMNAFYLADDTLTSVAAGSFGYGSLMNHSCLPNVFATYDLANRKQTFRALKAIAEGDELVNSYVDLMQTRAERGVVLMKDYAFRCSCPHCTDQQIRLLPLPIVSAELANIAPPNFVSDFFEGGWADGQVDVDNCLSLDVIGKRVVEPGLEGFDTQDINLDLQRRLQEACRRLDANHTLAEYLKALRELAAEFHTLNRSIYSMRCEAYSLALDEGKDDIALREAHWIVAVQTCVYAQIPNHPLRTLQLQTYGDLLLAAGQKQCAKGVFDTVVPALKICFGGDHLFYKLAEKQLSRLNETIERSKTTYSTQKSDLPRKKKTMT